MSARTTPSKTITTDHIAVPLRSPLGALLLLLPDLPRRKSTTTKPSTGVRSALGGQSLTQKPLTLALVPPFHVPIIIETVASPLPVVTPPAGVATGLNLATKTDLSANLSLLHDPSVWHFPITPPYHPPTPTPFHRTRINLRLILSLYLGLYALFPSIIASFLSNLFAFTQPLHSLDPADFQSPHSRRSPLLAPHWSYD